jgi:hypothetical protein
MESVVGYWSCFCRYCIGEYLIFEVFHPWCACGVGASPCVRPCRNKPYYQEAGARKVTPLPTCTPWDGAYNMAEQSSLFGEENTPIKKKTAPSQVNSSTISGEPLAARMRPRTKEDFSLCHQGTISDHFSQASP